MEEYIAEFLANHHDGVEKVESIEEADNMGNAIVRTKSGKNLIILIETFPTVEYNKHSERIFRVPVWQDKRKKIPAWGSDKDSCIDYVYYVLGDEVFMWDYRPFRDSVRKHIGYWAGLAECEPYDWGFYVYESGQSKEIWISQRKMEGICESFKSFGKVIPEKGEE